MEFKPTERKENFGNGRDEISMTGGQWNGTCVSTLRLSSSGMCKVKRSGIGQYHALGNYTLSDFTNDDRKYFDAENAWCLIYEEDIRKKFSKSFNPSSFDGVSDCSDIFTFTSKQSQYGDMNCHWAWWNDHYWKNEMLHNSWVIECNLNGGGNKLKFAVHREE